MDVFKIVIIIATLLSLYIFITKMYYHGKKGLVNAWQFPMLLAILIELYM